MGTFLFKWEHPASEVYVTGTFDDWKKSEQLEKVGEHFEKNVTLSDATKKIYYKFVVDGDWVTDHTAPKEIDESGNENNVLTPERINVPASPATAHTMSTVTPESTTAALAGAVPLEKNQSTDSADLPGAFPETPAAELEKQEIGINPLPATAGAVNPVTLAPGEKIPEHITAESITDNVRLDPESYEKADTLPGGVSAFTSSAAPDATTAELAGQVPLEAKVPEVVKESQEMANVEPEASAIPAEVAEKAEVESELLAKVKEAPSTSEGTAGKGTEKTESGITAGEAAASVAAAAGAIGAAAVAAVVAAKDAVVENAGPAAATAQATITEQAVKLPEPVKEKLPVSVQEQIGGATKEETIQEVSPQVPAEVKESIVEAGESPEAAANTEAVVEKKAVEEELLKEVKPAEVSAGEVSAPAAETSAPVAEKTTTPAVSEPVKPAETTAVTSTSAPANGTAAIDATTLEATATATTAEEAKAVAAKADPNGTTTAAATPATETTTPAKPAPAPTSTTSTPAESTIATEKKKKNRLSAFISKLKSKAK